MLCATIAAWELILLLQQQHRADESVRRPLGARTQVVVEPGRTFVVSIASIIGRQSCATRDAVDEDHGSCGIVGL
jgi:hypothetical protein